MREHLHRLLVGQKVFQVIEDENANPLLRLVRVFEPLLQPLDNRLERVLLDEIKQALLGLEIVIEPCERHTGGAGQVAHGRALVSSFVEYFNGMFEDFGQPTVEARLRMCDAGHGPPDGNLRSWRQSCHSSNVRSNISANRATRQELNLCDRGVCSTSTLSR